MEAQVSLRRGSLDDIGSLLAVQARAPGAALWSEADYTSLLPAQGVLCLLAQDGFGEQTVGFLLARAAADELEVLNLAVLPEYRRRGLGRRLLGKALAWGHAGGAQQCWLEVRASNQAAVGFYRALGFAEHSRRRRYYRSPEEDAVVLTRRLPSVGAPP